MKSNKAFLQLCLLSNKIESERIQVLHLKIMINIINIIKDEYERYK